MILFLDFDGVLHPEHDGQAVSADVAFCHLSRFEAVMREFPEVEIVISSTWREQFSLEILRARFSPDVACRIIDVTPVMEHAGGYTPARREVEILGWLAMAGRGQEPWLALDDAVWLFQVHRGRVVACDSATGLDDAVAAELRRRLR